jgi:hypothetical protein
MSDRAGFPSAGKQTLRYLSVIDRTPQIAPNYFKSVFFRDSKRTAHIPRHKWIWYGLLEVFFGEELLESLVTTASLSGSADAPDPDGKYGWPLQLSLQVPAGIFSNLLHRHLVELLYYKFHHQYLLIEPIANVYADETESYWDVTRVRFRFRKELLYQLIAFRRVYLAEALALNVLIDVVVFAVTQSGYAALGAALAVEALRRLMKL